MAEPTNLAPATPSDFYGVLQVTQTPLFVSVRGQPYMTVLKAKCRCYIDIPNRDGSTHRNTIDASFLGRSPPSDVEINSDLAAGVVTYGNGDLSVAGSASFPLTVTPFPETISGLMSQSDEVVGNPPWQTVNGRTMILWFDNVTAGVAPSTPPSVPVTANLVGACWADRYIDEGGAIPQFAGSVPPIFTPPP